MESLFVFVGFSSDDVAVPARDPSVRFDQPRLDLTVIGHINVFGSQARNRIASDRMSQSEPLRPTVFGA